MVMKTATKTKISFPPHLAYGVAIPETRRRENGEEVLDYYLHGERVLTARVGDHSATVQEWWKGQPLPSTTYPNLYQATLSQFALLDQGSSPIHAFWMRSLCAVGNIYVDRLPQLRPKQLHFPDLYRLTLHIPVREENTAAAFAFMQHPLIRKYGYRYYSTTLHINKLNGKQHVQAIHLLEVTAPLAYMHDVAKAAVAGSVILRNKLNRAFVQADLDTPGTQVKYWPATAGDDWKGYGVVLRMQSEVSAQLAVGGLQ